MASRRCPSLLEDCRQISAATGLTYSNGDTACTAAAGFVAAAFGWQEENFQWGNTKAQVLGFQRASWLLAPEGVDVDELKALLFPPEHGSNNTGGIPDGCYSPPGFGITGAEASEVFEQLGEFESAITAAHADIATWPFAPLIAIKSRMVAGRCHAQLRQAGEAEAEFQQAIAEAQRVGTNFYEMLAHSDYIEHVLDKRECSEGAGKEAREGQLAALGGAISKMVLSPSEYTPLLGAGLDAEAAVVAFRAASEYA